MAYTEQGTTQATTLQGPIWQALASVSVSTLDLRIDLHETEVHVSHRLHCKVNVGRSTHNRIVNWQSWFADFDELIENVQHDASINFHHLCTDAGEELVLDRWMEINDPLN